MPPIGPGRKAERRRCARGRREDVGEEWNEVTPFPAAKTAVMWIRRSNAS